MVHVLQNGLIKEQIQGRMITRPEMEVLKVVGITGEREANKWTEQHQGSCLFSAKISLVKTLSMFFEIFLVGSATFPHY